MSVYMTADRLAALKELRNRVDAEIKRAEWILRNRSRPDDRSSDRPAPGVKTDVIRAWLIEHNIPVGLRGRISDELRHMYADAHQTTS